MVCKNCGNEIKDDAKFCIKCGCKVEEDSSDKSPKKEYTKNATIIPGGMKGIRILILIIGVIMGVILYANLTPIRHAFYVNRGNAAFHNNDYEEALSKYDEAIKLIPDSEDAINGKYETYMHMAEVMHLQMKELEQSASMYKEALSLRDDLPEAYLKLSEVYMETEDITESLEILEKGMNKCSDTVDLQNRKESILDNVRIICKEYYANESAEMFAKDVFAYDEKGNLLKKENKGPENNLLSSVEYEYDLNGNEVASTSYIAFGDFNTTYKKYYNEKGELIKSEEYGNSLLSYTTYTYDASGRLLDLVSYEPNGTIKSGHKNAYNEDNGQLIERVYFDSQGYITYYEKYEYQNEGKIEICTEYRDDEFYSRTTNEYADDGELIKSTYDNGKITETEYSYNVFGDVEIEKRTYTDTFANINDTSTYNYKYQYQYFEKEIHELSKDDAGNDQNKKEPEKIVDTEIQIIFNAGSLMVGENANLEVAFVPENTSDKKIIWSSSDNGVLRINTDGSVTAISVGQATITATSQAGNTAEITLNIEELYYTVENLPNGVFVKREEKFYPITLGAPEGYNQLMGFASFAYWTEADEYDASDFLTIYDGDVIAYKGPIEGRNISQIQMQELTYYGYTLDILEGEGIDDAYKIYDYEGNLICNRASYVDDEKVNFVQIHSVKGWEKPYAINTSRAFVFGNFEKDEKHTIGYFEGTTYYEREVTANKWAATDGESKWGDIFYFETTKNGYFEANINVPKTGLYTLEFYLNTGGLAPYSNWSTMVWVEK